MYSLDKSHTSNVCGIRVVCQLRYYNDQDVS